MRSRRPYPPNLRYRHTLSTIGAPQERVCRNRRTLSPPSTAAVSVTCYDSLEAYSPPPPVIRCSHRYKVTKQADDGFEKAQKNWARLYAKFTKTKKAWKQNTKLVAAVNKKLDNPKNSMSTEDWNKLKEKQKKVDRAEERNKFKCEQRLKDLKDDESRYRNEMKEQFLSCQDVEQKR